MIQLEEGASCEKLLNIEKLRNARQFCDVMIIAGSNDVYAHSCVLAASSPVLFDMLSILSSNDWSISKPLKLNLSHLCKGELSNSCEDCILKVFDFMYCQRIAVDSSHFNHLTNISQYLKLKSLNEMCQKLSCQDAQGNEDIPKNLTTTSTIITPRLNNKSILKSCSDKEVSSTSGLKNDHRYSSEEHDAVKYTNDLSCSKCHLKFTSRLKYNHHKKVFHTKQFSCLSCDFTTLKLSYMVFHLMNMDHDLTCCSICSYDAPDKHSLKIHFQDHKSDFPYKCYSCGNVFRARSHWLRHSVLQSCKTCQESHNSEQNDHGVSHTTPNSCRVCSTHIDFRGKQFKKRMTANKVFQCPVTPCTFTTRYKCNLKDHLSSHNVVKSFSCEMCSLRFTLKKNLMRHLETVHTQERDLYECNLCDYKNARIDKAKIHCETSHKDDSQALCHIMKQHFRKKSHQSRKRRSVEKTRNKETNTEFDISATGNGGDNEVKPVVSNEEKITELSNNVTGKKTFILSETTGEFHIISENKGEAISVASLTSTNVLTIGNFREGTGSVTLNETTGVLTLNNINSDSTGAVFLNESTGDFSYINLGNESMSIDTGEMAKCNENETPDCDDMFDSFDMDLGNEDSCDGFDDLDGLIFDPVEFENPDIYLPNSQDSNLTEIPHLNETTGELSFDHIETQTNSQKIWSSKSGSNPKQAQEDSNDSYTLLLNEFTGELMIGSLSND